MKVYELIAKLERMPAGRVLTNSQVQELLKISPTNVTAPLTFFTVKKTHKPRRRKIDVISREVLVNEKIPSHTRG